jgi:hypothetical protein
MTSIPFALRPSRRTVIQGIAGVAGAATVGTEPFVIFGHAANLPARQDVVEFSKNAAAVAKFEAAIKEMQDRSAANPNDPKGWLINAKAHADFCTFAGPNPAADPNQIHFCWWFLSWHRAYIVVIERKIREIAGDQTLCYPYWNWSTDRHIPTAYARPGSALSNANRLVPDRAVDDGEVGYFPNDPVLKNLGVEALSAKIFEAKSRSDIRNSFGGIARPNPNKVYGNNRLESTPHGPIHNYVGGDMSDFETAGRDPIFFAHHGNLDRLWEIWRKDPVRKKTEPASDTFKQHEFVFTWLDGTPMKISAADTLDTEKLGYVYDNLEVFRPGVSLAMAAQAAEDRPPPIASETLKIPLPAQAAGENERKVLEITDVEQPDRPMTVGVYLKSANAPAGDLGVNVGSFAAVKSGGQVAWPSQTLSFDITAAAAKYAGQELTVDLIPYRIRTQAAGPETYQPLKYGQMRIVTEK